MFKDWKIQNGYLKIPIEHGAQDIRIKISTENNVVFEGNVPVSKERIDFWGIIPVSQNYGTMLHIETGEEKGSWCEGIRWEEGGILPCKTPVFHTVPPSGSIHSIFQVSEKMGLCRPAYDYDPFGRDKDRSAPGPDTGHGFAMHPVKENESFFSGDVETQYLSEDGRYCMAKSSDFDWENHPYFNMCTPLLCIEEENGVRKLSYGPEIEGLRIWKREWENTEAVSRFEALLRFRTKPGIWPNIELLPPEGKADDITAEAFEIHLELVPSAGEAVMLDFCGIPAVYDSKEGSFKAGGYGIAAGKEGLCLTACIDSGCAEFICGGKAVFYVHRTMENAYRQVDNSVSGNLEKCKFEEKDIPKLLVWCNSGTCRIRKLEIYGLRQKEDTEPYLNRFGIDKELDPVFYNCREFTVYYHRVWDKNYGYPEAAAVNDCMVVSPTRVVEEFDWRKTPWGDMNRIVNRENTWYGNSGLKNYPQLISPVASLNAAYNIALHVFEQCKDKKYALKGQEGLWSAGLFQGLGESFGVWLRDSVHILMRCGSLIDPKGAGRTLMFAMKKGFDNGSDGPAMGPAGAWDYYLATGNKELLYEMWPVLVSNIREADRRYDEKRDLVFAEKSTSNDAFPEPENGGYSLGTECYFMKAYESMAAIADVIGYSGKDDVRRWREKGRRLRQSVREKYWNPEYGYFTSGPKGSEAFEKGYWETSGEEGAIWNRFGIAKDWQRQSVLEKLEETAMTAYGIKLFPYRKEKNHFCGSVWGVWQSGFASAASASGNSALVKKLLAQQIRVCLINKTFYEVIDADTGKAWRWPGQLWNAAGFISLVIYGVFGLEYTEEGLSFHPAVPEELRDTSITGLPFWKMILNIRVCGWGTCLREMKLDGQGCDFIPHSLSGRHEIVLYMK